MDPDLLLHMDWLVEVQAQLGIQVVDSQPVVVDSHQELQQGTAQQGSLLEEWPGIQVVHGADDQGEKSGAVLETVPVWRVGAFFS